MSTNLFRHAIMAASAFLLLSCNRNEQKPDPTSPLSGQWQLSKMIVNGEENPPQCPIPWKYDFNDKVVKMAITVPTVNDCSPTTVQYSYTLADRKLTFSSSNVVNEVNTVNKLTDQELVYTKDNGNILYFTKM